MMLALNQSISTLINIITIIPYPFYTTGTALGRVHILRARWQRRDEDTRESS